MLELKVINDSINRITYQCGDYIITQEFVYGQDCLINVSTDSDLPGIIFNHEYRIFEVERYDDFSSYGLEHAKTLLQYYSHAIEVMEILTEKFID